MTNIVRSVDYSKNWSENNSLNLSNNNVSIWDVWKF